MGFGQLYGEEETEKELCLAAATKLAKPPRSELLLSPVNGIESSTYLSPVTSVTYPVGIPPPKSASMAGSMVLMTFHRDRSSLVAGPRLKLTASGLILELGSSVPDESPAAWFFSKPRSACRASIMRAESRRTSAGGT